MTLMYQSSKARKTSGTLSRYHYKIRSASSATAPIEEERVGMCVLGNRHHFTVAVSLGGSGVQVSHWLERHQDRPRRTQHCRQQQRAKKNAEIQSSLQAKPL